MSDPLRPEYDPVAHYVCEASNWRQQLGEAQEELAAAKAALGQAVKEVFTALEERDRARMLQKSSEEMSAARALEVEALKAQIAGLIGTEP